MLIQGIQFITGIQPVNPVLIDSYEGPYASISEANTSIPEVIRVQTRFVRIIDPINGLGKLYWYKDGVSDSNLVPYNDSVSSEILTSLSSTSPITYDSSKGIIGILQASSGTTGALSSADWNTFNNKVDKISNETIGGNKTFNGITTINNDLNINGNIYQSGATYETHAQQVYTTDDLIILRDGAVSGLPSSGVTGFTAKLYDGVHDGQLVFDNTGTARVGDIGGLQPLATREETPINQTFPYWDAISSKFKTESSPLGIDSNGNLVITGNVYATGSVSAYGSSSGTTGGGGGLIGTVYSYANLTSGSTTYLDNDLTSTFNAYTTYQLTQRIIGLEKGSATISSTYLPLSGGTLTGLLTANNGLTVNVNNGANNVLTVLNNGNVGVGTTAPSKLLSVGGSNQFTVDSNGNVTATSFVVSGGTSSQFLKADGSIDSNSYLTGITSTQVIGALGYTPYQQNTALSATTGTFSGLLTANNGLTIVGNNGANSVPITVDSNGNLVITGNVYATGSVSAYGSSSGTTGGGGGLIGTVYSYANLTSGSTTYLDNDLTSTFNAYTTYQLTQRIIGLEKGSATISSTYLPLSGGTLTGLLTASSGITVNGALSATTGTFSGLLTVNSGLTVNGTVTATSFVVSGGTSSQFLKADGSTDSNTYLTTSAATSNYLPLSGGTLTGLLTASSGITVNGNIKATGSGSTFGGLTVTGNNGSNSVPISVDSNGNLVITGNVYATGSVSAYGSSSGATGGGGGLISNVYSYANLTSGSTTYSDSDLTSTFNAYTINKINNDLSNQIANLETETNSFISDKNFVYTQNIPSSTWTILHNLNKYPSVSVVDSANTVVEGGITYVDLNTLTISFSAQFTGTAYLN